MYLIYRLYIARNDSRYEVDKQILIYFLILYLFIHMYIYLYIYINIYARGIISALIYSRGRFEVDNPLLIVRGRIVDLR